MRSAAVFLPILAACGTPDVEGVWAGDCELSSFTQSTVMEIRLDLDPVESGDVTGLGTIGESGIDTPIAVVGSANGKKVKLELQYDLGLPTGSTTDTGGGGGMTDDFDSFLPTFEIDAKVRGDEMKGTCAMKVMGFGTNSDIVLTRQ